MRLRAAPLAPHVVMIDGKPVTLDEKTTAYTVRVDDRPPVTVEVSHDRERYELASGLDPQVPHVVQVTREAEAFAGVHELLGIDLAHGGQFLPPRPRPLRIEVVGDSISCGYGVLGSDAHCPFTYATERATAAYGARLGRALDADVTTICWSGRGVLRNYDGGATGTMPELFERTLPADPPVPWSFDGAPAPDAVIVNLGTNDFLGASGRPLDLAAFEDAYVRFMRHVRDVYPKAFVFLVTSPMLKGETAGIARERLEHVVARRTGEGDTRIELIPLEPEKPTATWGCDSHPDAEMNGRMAARLEPVIRARLRP
ncbi:MAG: Endoglucanase precursor [Labilithrix sp.]|nr:Endoglucanase precursor [Labilithrix sp.]